MKKLSYIQFIEEYNQIIRKFQDNNDNTIPLCAAESTLSNFSKRPLDSDLQERYIKGSVLKFDSDKNFEGSKFIFPLYEKIREVCHHLYECSYSDARTLSGMNATISTLMSVTSYGDNILMLSPDSGGHESFPTICNRLGLNITYIPFDYENFKIDIKETNKLLSKRKFSVIFLAPSDIIFAPDLNLIKKDKNCIIIYDATQTLGLIAGNQLPNPFKQNSKIILTGGTHKTLPGPTSGLILCNDNELNELLDKTISPIYVRNSQPHQIASLLLTLIEFMEFGEEYMSNVKLNTNILGAKLEERGFRVAKRNSRYSDTHQLFILLNNQEANNIEINARKFRITLNKKDKAIYGEAGIRLGTQVITRYGWNEEDLTNLAEVFNLIKKPNTDIEKVNYLIGLLPKKSYLKYTL